MINKKKNPHVLFLFSNTGGGHRSASEAIIEALNLEYPNTFTWEMVDFFADYAPPPLNLAGPTYPVMSRMDELWKLAFETSDNPHRMRMIYASLWPYIRLFMYRLHRQHPCDIVVSVHPLINTPFLRAKEKKNDPTPYVTVVTDLVSTHCAWFNDKADLIVVPTQQAYQNGIRLNIEPEKLKIIGLPVADRFCHPASDRKALRRKLGWPEDQFIILLVGGGEGMGPLGEIAQKINQADLDATLVVITGRNARLQARLEKHAWKHPTFIYGFVTEMPDFMRAADVLLTKAGPGTICEALIAELPIILYHRISGQEEGNVAYVTDEGAGVWAPEAEDVVATLREWINQPEKRMEVVANSKRIARPQASREIARAIAEKVGL